MKKTLYILLTVCLLVLLSSCIQNPWKNRIIENALIERITPNIIHIQTTNHAGEISHYNINICDDVRWNGKSISLSDLQVGDRIRVTYDGAALVLNLVLIEGTTKIELLEDKISEPTKAFEARIESRSGSHFVVSGISEEYQNRNFSFFVLKDTHIVNEHAIIDPSALAIGEIIQITYRGEITDAPEIIRIEVVQSGE